MLHLPPGPNPQQSDGLLCLPGLLITTALLQITWVYGSIS